jgi:hypothetical protein
MIVKLLQYRPQVSGELFHFLPESQRCRRDEEKKMDKRRGSCISNKLGCTAAKLWSHHIIKAALKLLSEKLKKYLSIHTKLWINL